MLYLFYSTPMFSIEPYEPLRAAEAVFRMRKAALLLFYRKPIWYN